MALSLAEKLGATRNLLAFSLHPGFIKTRMAAHLDWSVEGPNMREFRHARPEAVRSLS
jgi:NAD(P)-dependent dehydrogenase (short-subunit alcohol dehydrogenase family)